MAYLAHEREMNAPASEGDSVVRDSLIQRANKIRRRCGVDSDEYREAMAEIDGPGMPSGTLDYLWGWSDELLGRSGVTMDGLAPLNPTVIESWARLTERSPQPHEVQALFELDALRRAPVGRAE